MSLKPVPMINASNGVVVEIWERRSVILTAFGLVGFGALVGAGSVYFFYIKRRIEEHFQIQSTVTSQLNDLKNEIDLLKSSVVADESNHSDVARKKSISSSFSVRRSSEGRRVRFNDGYETGDDDVYVSASSGEENDDLLANKRSKPGIDLDDIQLNAAEEDPQKLFFIKIDELLEGAAANQHEAYLLLKSNQDKLTSSFEFWWRFAKSTNYESNQAGNNGDLELKKNLSYAAFSYAEKGLELNDASSDAHKWYAITLGSKGEFLGINEKIKNGFIFKEHVDRAVKLNPQDSALHHLLGRFCFEVSQLSWLERKVAATLFSTPPTATVSEALGHFLKAEKIGKPFKENRLFIAKCYLQMNDSKPMAAQWLENAFKMPVISASDKAAHDQVVKLKK